MADDDGWEKMKNEEESDNEEEPCDDGYGYAALGAVPEEENEENGFNLEEERESTLGKSEETQQQEQFPDFPDPLENGQAAGFGKLVESKDQRTKESMLRFDLKYIEETSSIETPSLSNSPLKGGNLSVISSFL